MNINTELEKLMEEHGINVIDFKHEDKKIKLAEKYLNELFQSFGDDKSVCIYGAGIHTVHLLKSLTKDNKNKIKYIFGKRKVEELSDDIMYMDSIMNDISSIDCNIIVISSYSAAGEIEEELKLKDVKQKVINIYKWFGLRNLKFSYAYYYRTPCSVFDIIKEKEAFFIEKNPQKKDYLCRKIICMYFNIRDIIHGKEWCEKYKAQGGKYASQYQRFIEDLDKLLAKIRNKIKSRRERDIVINWVDALRYDEIEKTSYLKKISKESMFFENAYTVNPATSVAMEILMNGCMNMCDFENGLKKDFSYEKTIFLQKLKEMGYEFKYIGLSRTESSFSVTMRTDISKFHERKIEAPMTEIQWEALNCLQDADAPMCCLIHQVCETHDPNLCTEVNKESCCCWDELMSVSENQLKINRKLASIDNKQVSISRDYMDRQLEWYADFYQENMTKIYMSDHGKLCDYRFKREWLHIMLMVQDNRYKNRRISELFSLNKMKDLLEDILNGNSFENLAQDYCNIMFVPMYSVRYAKKIYSESEKEKKAALQFVGIMTKEDKYVKFDYGEEMYLRGDNEGINFINSSKYKNRIELLKNMMDKDHRCIDVYNNEYYEAGKLLNNSLGIIPGETILFGEGEYN